MDKVDLPKKFLEENLERAKTTHFLNQLLEEYTSEEILAIAAYSAHSIEEMREDHMRERRFLTDLHKKFHHV